MYVRECEDCGALFSSELPYGRYCDSCLKRRRANRTKREKVATCLSSQQNMELMDEFDRHLSNKGASF